MKVECEGGSYRHLVRQLLLAVSCLAVLFTTPRTGLPEDSGTTHASFRTDDVCSIFDKVAPAVVGISSRRGRAELYYGSGAVIDPAGLVLTSTTVVPRGAEEIQVYLRGGRVLPAKVVRIDEANELSLIRIEDGGRGRPFPWVELGDSSKVALGELALTFGNAFRSIEADDQVSMGRGVVSGFYDLRKTVSESQYTGPAIETSAPLNGGTDGGPLIDGEGRLIGVLSLNYSLSRWLGTAVPINRLKPLIRQEIAIFDDADDPCPGYAGLELGEADPGEIQVVHTQADSPAAGAGLLPGDRVRAIDGEKPGSIADFRKVFSRARPGQTVTLEVWRNGEARKIQVLLWGKF